MKKQIAVIGLGRFGSSLASTLVGALAAGFDRQHPSLAAFRALVVEHPDEEAVVQEANLFTHRQARRAGRGSRRGEERQKNGGAGKEGGNSRSTGDGDHGLALRRGLAFPRVRGLPAEIGSPARVPLDGRAHRRNLVHLEELHGRSAPRRIASAASAGSSSFRAP